MSVPMLSEAARLIENFTLLSSRQEACKAKCHAKFRILISESSLKYIIVLKIEDIIKVVHEQVSLTPDDAFG